MTLNYLIAVATLVLVGLAIVMLREICRMLLIQAIWTRKSSSEKLLDELRQSEYFSDKIYLNIVQAKIPDSDIEVLAFESVMRGYINYYYSLELAKRDFSVYSYFKSAEIFLSYIDNKQGNIKNLLYNVMVHKELSKYFFQGPFEDDEILFDEFHRVRSRVTKSQISHPKALEQTDA